MLPAGPDRIRTEAHETALSSAYPNADATGMNIDWDLTPLFRGLEFLSRHARGLAFADPDRLTAMGHSYGGQAALAWCAEPASPVAAMVTLDATIENVALDHPGFARLKRHFQAHKLNLRAPLLLSSRPSWPKPCETKKMLTG